ncbi:hypothetical protein [Angustibacter sp. Root456]|uniref:hypothetical protein n=1 Tax=Angustibacter sp. Root456 TaxID=1736539 RepID=UPI0006F2545B|nr:hypothetical protein [Angustibacter sp. Root456]KQX66284.1 hypothetical protein ASD06_08010 [Angustibacter sp. Root456]
MAHPTIDHEPSVTPQASVRELIAELARVEDAVRVLPTYVDGEAGPRLNPELLVMIDREREIVARLRRIDLRDAAAERVVREREATAGG